MAGARGLCSDCGAPHMHRKTSFQSMLDKNELLRCRLRLQGSTRSTAVAMSGGVCKTTSSAAAADGSANTKVSQRSASALLRAMDVNGEAQTGRSAGGYASNKLAQVLHATCPQTNEQGASGEADPQKFSLHAGHFKENGDDMGK